MRSRSDGSIVSTATSGRAASIGAASAVDLGGGGVLVELDDGGEVLVAPPSVEGLGVEALDHRGQPGRVVLGGGEIEDEPHVLQRQAGLEAGGVVAGQHAGEVVVEVGRPAAGDRQDLEEPV